MEQIAVFRSEGGSFQKYVTLLNANNFDPVLVPSIDFKYKNQPELAHAINHPDNFSGIIFTSPRSVTSVSNVLSGESLKSEWKTKQNYCVGLSTWTEANTLLKLDLIGKESGSASKLAEVIVNDFKMADRDKSPLLPLLFYCSSIKSDTLPEKLSSNGIPLKTLDAYDTIPHPKLEENLYEIISNPKITFLVFFSPSGVDAYNDILQKNGWALNDKKLIAIGETTTKAIIKKGLICHGTAKTPSPEGLLECLLGQNKTS